MFNVYLINRTTKCIENYVVVAAVKPDSGPESDPTYLHRTYEDLASINPDFDRGWYADLFAVPPVVQELPFP